MKSKLSKVFKKPVLGAVIVSSLLLSQGIFASPNVPISGGSVNLDEISNQRITLFGSEVKVGGGTWEYGVGPVNVYSYYQHLTKDHSATAEGLRTKTVKKLAGTEAKARTIKNPAGGNKARWNTF